MLEKENETSSQHASSVKREEADFRDSQSNLSFKEEKRPVRARIVIFPNYPQEITSGGVVLMKSEVSEVKISNSILVYDHSGSKSKRELIQKVKQGKNILNGNSKLKEPRNRVT